MNISDDLLDALKEVINISLGKAAGTLNELLNNRILLEVPQIVVINPSELESHISKRTTETISLVSLPFNGQLSGLSTLLFTSDCASKLVDMLMGEEMLDDDLDAIKSGTLTEIGNILLNAVVGSIGNILNSHLSYSIPSYYVGNLGEILLPILCHDSAALEITTRFTVQNRHITGEFLLLFEVGSFDFFVESLEAAING
jgi:chemotaxis protein CheC